MDVTKSEYASLFEGDNLDKKPKALAALHFAADVRKFEIDMYWKRAAYFWAFSALALGAYSATLGSKTLENKPELLLLVACVGLVFSTAWYLVNRSSKYWQLNWEYHVGMLEDEVIGPLYKTVLHEKTPFWKIQGPLPMSVSKINQLLSLYVVVIFGVLISTTLYRSYRLAHMGMFAWLCLGATALALTGFFTLGFTTRREGDKHKSRPEALIRDTRVTKIDRG